MTTDVTDVQINELAFEAGCLQDEMMVALCDLAVGRPLAQRRSPDALIETLRSRGYLLQAHGFVCPEDRALARVACVRVIRFQDTALADNPDVSLHEVRCIVIDAESEARQP